MCEWQEAALSAERRLLDEELDLILLSLEAALLKCETLGVNELLGKHCVLIKLIDFQRSDENGSIVWNLIKVNVLSGRACNKRLIHAALSVSVYACAGLVKGPIQNRSHARTWCMAVYKGWRPYHTDLKWSIK